MTEEIKYKPDHPFSANYRGSVADELIRPRFGKRAHEPRPDIKVKLGGGLTSTGVLWTNKQMPKPAE